MDSLVLWLAQGFGLGRLPFAPGTFGTAAGLVWFALLVALHSYGFVLGLVLGCGSAVWITGRAEQILGQKDPNSVVLDEIVAVPVCFLSWIVLRILDQGAWPLVGSFFSGYNCLLVLAIFGAFRLFDIAKPWPIRQSQALAAGWGVTVDDLLAAGYVNVCFLAGYGVWQVGFP